MYQIMALQQVIHIGQPICMSIKVQQAIIGYI